MMQTLDIVETKIDLAEPRQDDELELVERARQGSREAFDALFQRHKSFIYNVCHRMLGSAEDAIDATQTAFVHAYRNIKRFRREAGFRSWLCRIAMNAAIDMARRAQRRKALAASRVEHETTGPQSDRVREALREVPPDLRAALVLFYFQGLSGEEAAAALGCSTGAFRTRLHRARAAFKACYEELDR